MAKSTTKRSRGKTGRSAKPYDDFSLLSQAAGRRAKQVRSQLEFFGS